MLSGEISMLRSDFILRNRQEHSHNALFICSAVEISNGDSSIFYRAAVCIHYIYSKLISQIGAVSVLKTRHFSGSVVNIIHLLAKFQNFRLD